MQLSRPINHILCVILLSLVAVHGTFADNSQVGRPLEVQHGHAVPLSRQSGQGQATSGITTPVSSSALPDSGPLPGEKVKAAPGSEAKSLVYPTEESLRREKSQYPFEIVRRVSYPSNTVLLEFSNGLVVIVQERAKTERSTVRLYIRNTGSMNEGKLSGSGISHLLEHLIAQGATNRQGQEEVAVVLNRLGGANNAWTSGDLTSYYIDCSASDTAEAIGLLADLVNNAKLDKSRFETEKSVIRQESLDARNDIDEIANTLLMHTFYTVHPCRYPIEGYPDVFDAISFENVKEFYTARYVPNNQVLVVVGDVTTSTIIEEVTRSWSTIPRGPEYFQGTVVEPAQISPRLAFREIPGTTCLAQFVWPGTRQDDPDAYALDVLATVLSQGATSRLVERLRRKEPLAIDVTASHQTEQNIHGRFVVSAEVTPENLEKLETAILDELYRLREFPVTSAELNRARKQTLAALVFEEESGQDMADSLALNYIATGDPCFQKVYLSGIQKVSIEDLRRVAQKYITPETLTKVLLTPPGMAPRQVEKGGQRIAEEIQAVSFQESNLRLLMKKTNEVPMVNIQFSLLAGSLVETDATAGQSAVLAAMLDQGSQKYTQKEVAAYFDSIGSQLIITAGHHTIRAEATVLKDDVNEAFAVMFDAFFNPLLTEETFQKARQSQLDRIAARSTDPMAEVTDLFCQSLPSATVYHLPSCGTTESVKRLKLDDLRQFHQKYFHPDNMVISIFGDFDPNKAATELSSLLQHRPFTTKAPAISFERTNELIQPIREHKKTGRTVALGIVAWATVSAHAQKEIATLTVLQTILGGYGYPDGKLFNTLRRQQLVYRFFIEQILGPVPGYMIATFETRPDRVTEVLETIDRHFTDIQQGKITAEELQEAKRRIIAYHAIKHGTMSQKARQCSLDELYGLGFANDFSFSQRIQEVTLDDVIASARRFARQKIVVTTSPQEVSTP